MRLASPLLEGTFVRRYKRFFVDVRVAERLVTAHCANSGSMATCFESGGRVWISYDDNPQRKLKYTWLLAEVSGARIFVHPVYANRVAREAIEMGVIGELRGYEVVATEPRIDAHTRFDFLLTRGKRKCYVEVKSATLLLDGGRVAFPDAVTARGTKHLRELAARAKGGHRAVLLFCANRTDAASVQPADRIDPLYGETLRWAVDQGVEVMAYRVEISLESVTLVTRIPVVLTP